MPDIQTKLRPYKRMNLHTYITLHNSWKLLLKDVYECVLHIRQENVKEQNKKYVEEQKSTLLFEEGYRK